MVVRLREWEGLFGIYIYSLDEGGCLTIDYTGMSFFSSQCSICEYGTIYSMWIILHKFEGGCMAPLARRRTRDWSEFQLLILLSQVGGSTIFIQKSSSIYTREI